MPTKIFSAVFVKVIRMRTDLVTRLTTKLIPQENRRDTVELNIKMFLLKE